MKNKRIVALEQRRDTLNTELTKLDEAVIERGSDLTADEQTNYDEMQSELDQVNTDLGRLIKRENDIQASLALGASLGNATDKTKGKLDGKDDDGPIYRADAEWSFLRDIHSAKQGNGDAQERLAIHRAASATSDLPGVVVPSYLADKYTELAVQRGRPFLNTLVGTLSYRPTINEMSVVIPVETQAPSVGAQATQNSAFSTQAWTTTELTVATNTIGAYIDISVQAATFGGGLNDMLFNELLTRHYNQMDYLALHGSGSSGEPEGLFNADGTQVVDADTVSAFAEHIAVVNEAASKIETTDFRESQYLLMSPGRWRALLSATESTGRPLAGFNGSFPQNVGAYNDVNGVKWFAGLRVVTDPNVVKSGEDDTFMAVYNTDAFYFAETEPKRITADQVVIHTGSVRFVTYGFMQFTPERRVNSLCIIQDLTPPEFPTLAVS